MEGKILIIFKTNKNRAQIAMVHSMGLLLSRKGMSFFLGLRVGGIIVRFHGPRLFDFDYRNKINRKKTTGNYREVRRVKSFYHYVDYILYVEYMCKVFHFNQKYRWLRKAQCLQQ